MAKINKTKLLKGLKADLKSSETLQKEWLETRDTWINETYGKPYGNEQKGKSAIVSKDIKKQLEWMLPSITDPFLSAPDVIKCTPVTFEDAKSARQNELLLNTQFCRKFQRYNFIMKATRVLATEGTVIVQTGWEYEDEEEEVEVPIVQVDPMTGQEYIAGTEMVMETVVKKNQPTAIVCRNEDIFIDPTCMDDMDKCQFVIHRYETDLSTLKADGRYKNLKRVAQQESGEDLDYDSEDETEFKFEDSARKKVVVHEYWGNYDIDDDGIVEPIVCAWVGDTIIRLEDNPYPDAKPPFIVVPFNAIPFQMYGEALAENIGDNQKIRTAVKRGVLDNLAASNNGQVGIRRGALDANNRKKWLAGKHFEFNGTPGDFWEGSYNSLPATVFNVLAMESNEIESQTGTKSFSGGISGSSLGATATGARGALDATATRRLNLVRNISENLMKPLLRKWMSYNSEFLEEEEVVRVTNEEYVPVRRDDLSGRVDIEISVSTAEDNAAKSQELSFLLQTLGPNEDPTIRRELMADIYELMRMPDKAQKLREYKPEPDPLQEQLKAIEVERLQLENEKLRAEIADKYARAGENEVDRVLKEQKAQVEAMKARKLGSEADKIDLDFLMKDQGLDHEREMQKKEFDRMSKLDEKAMDALARRKETI